MGKLDAFKDRVTVVPGPTNNREVIRDAVSGCDGVLTVLVPWGVEQYSTGTAQAVLDWPRLFEAADYEYVPEKRAAFRTTGCTLRACPG